MIVVIATLGIPSENLERAREPIGRLIAATRAEDGCVSYNFAEDLFEPGVIHIAEQWRDRAALDAHAATPHFAEWRAASAEVGVDRRKIIVFQADDGETF